MEIICSILIVIVLGILLFLLHQTNHPFLYSILFIDTCAIILIKILPKLKNSNMEQSGVILICGLYGICLFDMILAKLNDKKK